MEKRAGHLSLNYNEEIIGLEKSVLIKISEPITPPALSISSASLFSLAELGLVLPLVFSLISFKKIFSLPTK